MNVLINSDEWAAPQVRRKVITQIQNNLAPAWSTVDDYVKSCKNEFKNSGLITVDFNYVNRLLFQCLQEFRNDINRSYKSTFRQLLPQVVEQLQQNINEQKLIDDYLNDPHPAFAKTVAPWLAEGINWVISKSNIDWSQPLFIRNILNNEEIIKHCLEQNKDFWFVDSGYTNFLHDKKKIWHRLVKNNIHQGACTVYLPTDRLSMFPGLPAKWRRKGDKILVIESSASHYSMQGTTLEKWKESVTDAIRAVSDRPIEFRPKQADRKTRTSVYELLKDTKEYYCVVSDSSAAAVEAIWTGTPAVTLQRHITNSVARSKLSQINELYREDLEQWLTVLSYSQFTFEELANGTAAAIAKEFQNV